MSHRDDQLASSGDSGVDQVALQHDELLGCNRNQDDREFGTLRLVNGDRIGEGELVEFPEVVDD